MKKILAIVLTALMLATLSLTAIAVNTTGGEADITTSIEKDVRRERGSWIEPCHPAVKVQKIRQGLR